MGAELTVRQKILVAAASLEGDSDTFSVEELIVKTWNMFPESFSLRGYHAQFPDSNRVLAKLSGSDGVCGLGWLEHAESRVYRVTRKGRVLAKQLAAMRAGTGTGPLPTRVPRAAARHEAAVEAEPHEARGASGAEPRGGGSERVERTPPPPPVQEAPRGATVTVLSTQDAATLVQIARSDTLRKFMRGQPLSFTDACAFWGISAKSRPNHVQERLQETTDLLKRAVEAFGEGVAPDPRLPSLSTCYGVFNLHRLMLEKFSRELDAIRLPLAAG